MVFKHNIIAILAMTVIFCVAPMVSNAGDTIPAAATDRHNELLSRYRQIELDLRHNQYGAPIYIQSTFGDEFSQGDVYALVGHEFAAIAQSLKTPTQWCDVVLQHINVKGCDVDHGANRHVGQTSATDHMTIYVGRDYYQTPDDAHEMRYQFVPKVIRDDYVQVDLTAKDGPLGTSNYKLIFEAIPFDDNTSFIHFQYAYQYGFMARLALDGYLATLGRHKVGFSVTGYDDNNEPLYVKGLQGIVERNSMRYFISIRSYLDTASLNAQQWSQRIDHWYDLAKRFERQLNEVRDGAYVKTKTQEYSSRNQSDDNKAAETVHAANDSFEG